MPHTNRHTLISIVLVVTGLLGLHFVLSLNLCHFIDQIGLQLESIQKDRIICISALFSLILTITGAIWHPLSKAIASRNQRVV